jgi:hypothetical protein
VISGGSQLWELPSSQANIRAVFCIDINTTGQTSSHSLQLRSGLVGDLVTLLNGQSSLARLLILNWQKDMIGIDNISGQTEHKYNLERLLMKLNWKFNLSFYFKTNIFFLTLYFMFFSKQQPWWGEKQFYKLVYHLKALRHWLDWTSQIFQESDCNPFAGLLTTGNMFMYRNLWESKPVFRTKRKVRHYISYKGE